MVNDAAIRLISGWRVNQNLPNKVHIIGITSDRQGVRKACQIARAFENFPRRHDARMTGGLRIIADQQVFIKFLTRTQGCENDAGFAGLQSVR